MKEEEGGWIDGFSWMTKRVNSTNKQSVLPACICHFFLTSGDTCMKRFLIHVRCWPAVNLENFTHRWRAIGGVTLFNNIISDAMANMRCFLFFFSLVSSETSELTRFYWHSEGYYGRLVILPNVGFHFRELVMIFWLWSWEARKIM